MGTFSVTMKKHSETDLTKDFLFIHDCIVHGVKPKVLDIVAGRRKEHHYVVTCGHDECIKLSMESAAQIVHVWNNYNPIEK